MKMLLLFGCLFLGSISATARDWRHIYVATELYRPLVRARHIDFTPYDNNYYEARFSVKRYSIGICSGRTPCAPFVWEEFVWERPKGAVFCRMEDYLTAKTKVWFKVGVK